VVVEVDELGFGHVSGGGSETRGVLYEVWGLGRGESGGRLDVAVLIH
jgi:hypothetical protein